MCFSLITLFWTTKTSNYQYATRGATQGTDIWQRALWAGSWLDEVCIKWIKVEKEIHLCRYWAAHRSSESFVSTLQKTDNCFTFFPDALLANSLKAPQMRLFKSTLNAAATTLWTDAAHWCWIWSTGFTLSPVVRHWCWKHPSLSLIRKDLHSCTKIVDACPVWKNIAKSRSHTTFLDIF